MRMTPIRLFQVAGSNWLNKVYAKSRCEVDAKMHLLDATWGI